MRQPKYRETAADKALREDIERRRKEEEAEKAAMEKEKKYQKS